MRYPVKNTDTAAGTPYTATAMRAGTTAILNTLHRHAAGYLAFDELRRRTGESAATVTAGIAELQQMGYQIEIHPHFGLRWLGSPDRLTVDEICALVNSRVIGREVLVFEETTSTNDVVERLARSDAQEGVVVFAEAQTRGRGRHGRKWESPRGKGLWFSVLLRPALPVAAYSRITVAASVAVARAVEARIKWPNDVVIRERKLAGILTETGKNAVILGIGVNVNNAPEDFPSALRDQATSLRIETGHPQDRAALAASLLGRLDDYYHRAQTNFEAVAAEWADLCVSLGKQIVVRIGHRRIEGEACALDGDGALLVRRDHGHIERLLAGDVIQER